MLLLDTLRILSSRDWLSDKADKITLWYIHSLAQREFANVRNSSRVRVFATMCIQRDMEITVDAKRAAEDVITQQGGDSKLLAAARDVSEYAAKYGVEEFK